MRCLQLWNRHSVLRRLCSGSMWRHCLMGCKLCVMGGPWQRVAPLLNEVLGIMESALCAEKVGQWQCVTPLLNEMLVILESEAQ
eukprot:3486023-Karenia_brevis.AAC.1